MEQETKHSHLEQEGSKWSWEELPMVLLAATLRAAVPEEGWKKERGSPGV